MNRRQFLTTSAKLTAVLGLTGITGIPQFAMAKKNNGGNMVSRTLGKDLEVSAIGLGCMVMSGLYGSIKKPENMKNVIAEAVDLGVNFFDTAEMYGNTENEKIVGPALKNYRKKVKIATKFGIDYVNGQQVQNSRPERIRKAIEGSLKRLETDYIDLYYQHRVDPEVPIEDVAGVIKDLAKEGKILHWGLSEPGLNTIKRAHKEFPLTAVQNQYSVMYREVEKKLIPLLDELKIGLVPWSPLDLGYIAGNMDKNTKFEKHDYRNTLPRFTPEAMQANRKVIDFIEKIAKEKKATNVQIALSWLLAQRPYIVPIPGTTNIEHLRENIKAVNITYSKAELAEINKELSNIEIVGQRYMPGSLNEKRAGIEAPEKK